VIGSQRLSFFGKRTGTSSTSSRNLINSNVGNQTSTDGKAEAKADSANNASVNPVKSFLSELEATEHAIEYFLDPIDRPYRRSKEKAASVLEQMNIESHSTRRGRTRLFGSGDDPKSLAEHLKRIGIDPNAKPGTEQSASTSDSPDVSFVSNLDPTVNHSNSNQSVVAIKNAGDASSNNTNNNNNNSPGVSRKWSSAVPRSPVLSRASQQLRPPSPDKQLFRTPSQEFALRTSMNQKRELGKLVVMDESQERDYHSTPQEPQNYHLHQDVSDLDLSDEDEFTTSAETSQEYTHIAPKRSNSE